ncbi:MAG: thiamine-phosphate kinase [Candidatus Omnitrophota bacterium]|jgi:thiamine-monophosphate kinase
MRLDKLGEFNFIKRISSGTRLSSGVIKGIGDDAAVLKCTGNRYLLFTTDMLVEGKHFSKSHKPYLVGKKSISCNISDIAAMGGRPVSFVISLGAPGNLDTKYTDELYRGIEETAKKFRIDLVGGDTVASEKIVLNIAMLGEVKKKNLVLRNGAKKGDAVFITGAIGGSIKRKHLVFTPRLEEAGFLVKNFKINSMIDVSDGLLADLGHILEESHKGAVIYENAVPVSREAKGFDQAVRDGEDFELIFTLSRKDAGKLKSIWPFRTRLSEIGEVLDSGKKFSIVRKNGKTENIKPTGFTHF